VLALVLAAALASQGEPASATSATSARPATTVTPVTVTAKAPDANKIVCRDEEVVGSRMSKRVCRTQGQIDAQQKAADEFFRQVQDSNGLQDPRRGAMANTGPGGF
jgi:hypothetical protein